MQTRKQIRYEAWSRRPHFTPGQSLSADQLNAGLDDELQRQRLLNRALHGHGVVFGYALSREADGGLVTQRECIELSCGLALDPHGRMLYFDGGWLGMRDIVGKQPTCEGRYTLRAHYAERLTPPDECGPCPPENARFRERRVVFTLSLGCDRAERECVEHPIGACISHEDFLRQRTGAVHGPLPPQDDLRWACAEPGPLCRTDCGDWLYDPNVSIPVACVEVRDLTRTVDGAPVDGAPVDDPACEPRYGFGRSADACSVRPYVYRAPLLYELLNCCDVELPSVRAVRFRRWLRDAQHGRIRPVPRSEFQEVLRHERLWFSVLFTKPVVASTLHTSSVFLTAFIQDGRSDYWLPHQVPCHVFPLNVEGDLAKGVVLVPTREWIEAEVIGSRSSLDGGARFEFTIRGQLLRDECGQMFDARPLDIDGRARCQGRPGDDFVAVFHVAKDEECDDRYHLPPDQYDIYQDD